MSTETKLLEIKWLWWIVGIAGTVIFFGFTGWITYVQARIADTANNVAVVKDSLVNTDKESTEKVNAIENRVTRVETQQEEIIKRLDSIASDVKESNKILSKYK